ncbi:restriction endonuclease subunit S [Aeromonas salmonicida]|uniref:restriction endonuclease subunit S n=1 Tax=Aeromonas salmonicida TaxID=645 RepID=UPI0038BAB28F
MSSEWRKQKLSNLGTFDRGKSKHRPRDAAHLYGGPYPFIQTGDVTAAEGRITSYRQTYSEAGLAQSKLWPTSTLCITIAANIAETALLTFPACFPDSVVGFTVDKTKADIRYIEYVFRAFRESVKRRAYGSVQENINLEVLRDLEFPIPSLQTQECIADFLTLFDDRIALLRETNATLEAIAQALFKSWFVDFDPVHARARGEQPDGISEELAALFPDSFEESPLGLVPKGWRVTSLKEAVSIFDSKRIPLSGAERTARKGWFPYYGAAALMDYVDDYLFDGVYLLLGEDGSVTNTDGYPVTQYVWGKIWVNNHAHVLQGANGISTEHLMLAIKRINIQPFVTGAVQAKLSQGNMWRIPFLMPTQEIAEAFGEFIAPLFVRYRHNAEQAQTLAALRDTLLPRLISGQLRLPEIETTPETGI